MTNTIIFLSIFILILSIMLVIKIDFDFDMFNNYLLIKIKIFGIQILNIYISIIGLYITINNKKKLKTLNVLFDKNQEYLLMQMKKSIIDKLYIDNIKIDSKLGLNDAYTTTMFVTIINNFLQIVKNNLSSKYDIDLDFENEINFINNEIKLNASIKVYFTIFDLIFALLSSFYKRSRYAKKRKNKNKL